MSKSLRVPAWLLTTTLAPALAMTACGTQGNLVEGSGSTPSTVDLPHTQVKWQSIGNCWVYAALGWMESQYLLAHNKALNLSESYITYRHFEQQLLAGYALDELNTGGSWGRSTSLMLRYGIMTEGDFLPHESHETFSATQAQAVDYLNASLKNGRLASDRSAQTVRAELDAAFGVDIEALSGKILKLAELPLSDGKTMEDEIRNWNVVSWPIDWASRPSASELPADRSEALTASQKSLLARVKRALNDGHPVVMNWWVDFNALDSTGTFDLDTVAARGPGSQGYHSTVIEDYVVSGIDPTTGKTFRVGEGEASAADKRLAAQYGDIEYFVIKNSWGGAERVDRPSYSRFGEKGYARLTADYLFGYMKQVDKQGEYTGMDTGLNGFVLPMGY